MRLKERYEAVLAYFKHHHPHAETELMYDSPYQLLVAVILSAQCTDKRVNLVTPALFKRFKDAKSLAAAGEEEIFELIKSVSYPNNKARHLKGMAELLHHRFKGEVPHTLEDLMSLPGVGRKTANVISSVIYNQPAMAVDTHVFRVSARLGLTRGAKNPLQAERQLVKHIPEDLIATSHHWLILHGRYVCKARQPLCGSCELKALCVWYAKNYNSAMR